MTQKEFARLVVGVDPVHFSGVLTGKRSPGVKLARKLAAITGVGIEVWLNSSINGLRPKDHQDWQKYSAKTLRSMG